MGTPYLGEIKISSFNFPPKGWAFCNGQFLPINQNQALFSILGTTYGGNGQTTFALPDLRGRAPIHEGAGFQLGQAGGQEFHTVTLSEMPAHVHPVNGSSQTATTASPAGNVWAVGPTISYGAGSPDVTLAPQSVTNSGGSQPHENRQPYLVVSFIIALQGAFPSQN